jgi:hypothetical protein
MNTVQPAKPINISRMLDFDDVESQDEDVVILMNEDHA